MPKLLFEMTDKTIFFHFPYSFYTALTFVNLIFFTALNFSSWENSKLIYRQKIEGNVQKTPYSLKKHYPEKFLRPTWVFVLKIS